MNICLFSYIGLCVHSVCTMCVFVRTLHKSICERVIIASIHLARAIVYIIIIILCIRQLTTNLNNDYKYKSSSVWDSVVSTD